MRERKRKILWCGDAAVASGFAKCTHSILERFLENWEIAALGINYNGDPHRFPYPVYPCVSGGDLFGLNRIAALAAELKPDVVAILNDPWNVPLYLSRLGAIRTAASMPVDGKNCRGRALNGLALAVFWTEFGRREAIDGGYSGRAEIVPLGVDLRVYRPGDRTEARKKLGIGGLEGAFIVGNVNRNQPRKRLDLTVDYFATWIREYGVRDAYLYVHVAPTGNQGYDMEQLAGYHGMGNRLILAEPPLIHGWSESHLAETYRAMDVQVTTTQGEGWGLTTMEGMACGIPQIVPNWAALGEWAAGAAMMIPCKTTMATPNRINVIGGIADKRQFVEALQQVYEDRAGIRERMTANGTALAERPEYRWEAIGDRYDALFRELLDSPRRIPR